MTQFIGSKFIYYLDGQEIDITKVENFNNLSYTTKVDGLNVYFTTVPSVDYSLNAPASFATKKLEEETLEKLKGKFVKASDRANQEMPPLEAEFSAENNLIGHRDLSKFAQLELEKPEMNYGSVKTHETPSVYISNGTVHVRDNGTGVIIEGVITPNYWSRTVGSEDKVDMVHSNPFNKEEFCAKKERAEKLLKESLSTRHKSEDVETHPLCWRTTSEFGLTMSPQFKKEVDKNIEDWYKVPQVDQDKVIKTEPLESFVGIKETEGKLDYSEVNFEILDLMAERFTANKHKYPQGNMKKPIDIKGLEFALFRHLRKMIQPLDNDVESYKEHLAAILCNASMILDQLNLQEKK